METSYFYCDDILNIKSYENDLHNYANTNKRNIYLLKMPKGTYEENKYRSVMILSPGYKIAMVNFEINEQEFDDYCYDVESAVSHLYKTYEYGNTLGRFREIWQQINIKEKNHSFFDKLDAFFKENYIADPRIRKWSTIIISLCTGSINDITRVKADVPRTLLEKVKQKIQLFDADQTRFIYSKSGEGKIVKIQGLSGTGKTELLLHRLKEIYTNKSAPKIFVTCHNKILADSLFKKIPEFFNFMKIPEQIEWEERLWCANAWGRYGDENSGLYRYVCYFYNLPYQNYSKSTTFDRICEDAISRIEKKPNREYAFDYIIIDECQDFPDSFFKLCELITSNKVYMAGDIFQSIFETHDIKDYQADYFLTKCYRTDPRTLMFAHAISMGLFEARILRWLRKEDWEACGYIYTEDDNNLYLTREPVHRFSDVDENYNSVEILSFEENSIASSVLNTIKAIQNDNNDVSINDICIILMDDGEHIYQWANMIESLVSSELNWEVNKAYETKKVKKDQLLMSNRNNVKGLEYPFVICITKKFVANESYRNSLYTMLTRSFIKSYLLMSSGESENISVLNNRYKKINDEKQLTLKKISKEEQGKIETRFKQLKKRKPLAEEIRELLYEKGVSEKKIEKLVSLALQMEWESLDKEELENNIKTFVNIYGSK